MKKIRVNWPGDSFPIMHGAKRYVIANGTNDLPPDLARRLKTKLTCKGFEIVGEAPEEPEAAPVVPAAAPPVPENLGDDAPPPAALAPPPPPAAPPPPPDEVSSPPSKRAEKKGGKK